MICRTCQTEIPGGALCCVFCLEKQSRQEILNHQKRFLPGIMHGTFSLILVQRGKRAVEHLALVDGTETWCGHVWRGPIATGHYSRRSERLSEELMARICADCRTKFQRLAAEALEQTVREISPGVA